MKTSSLGESISVVFRLSAVFLLLVCSIDQASGQFKKLKQKLKVPSSLQEVVSNEKTRDFLVKQLDEARAEYDTGSFNYAISLSDNAGLFENKERFERHQKILSGALKKEEEITPLEEATQYNDVADMLAANGKYKSAEFYYLASLSIFIDEGLTEHNQYFKTIANLGLVYHTTGRLVLAETFTQRAHDLRRDVLGENTGAYASSMNNLAVLRKDQGRYTEAESLLRSALETNTRTLGADHLSTAIILNNQAILAQTVGRADQAEPLMEKAIEISNESLKEKSGNYQKLMVNLALIYQDLGRFEEAEETYKRAIELKEKRFGKKHPDYAHMLNNLAALYLIMQKYQEVEDLLIRSSRIYEDKFGRNHPSFANAISNLGNFLRVQGRLDEAEPLLREAQAIQLSNFGNENPSTVKATEDLALLLWSRKEVQEAHGLFNQSLDQSLEFIEDYFPAMSEAEKTKYWDKLRPRFQRFYSFAVQNQLKIPELAGEMYNYHLATKALLLSVSTKAKARIMESGDKSLIRDYLVWVDQKESLALFYQYSKQQLLEEKVNLDSLENATNTTEKRLSERSELFARGFDLKSHNFQDVRNTLASNEAVVEVVQCQVYEGGFSDRIEYVGLVLKGGESGPPVMVVLENGKELEGRYYNYYKNSIKQKQPDEHSFRQYWAAIDKELGSAERVFLSVDGIYNQINLSTLQRVDGTYVIESTDIFLIGNSKDLIEASNRQATGKTTGKTAWMLGFPNFGSEGSIDPLPGTKAEIESLRPILERSGYDQLVFIEDDAREENLKRVSNPDILHLATHGFFIQNLDLSQEQIFGIDVQKVHQEPLLRSGLLLAGAESALTGEPGMDLAGEDNGILTAFEAVTLSLDNTDIVVLSACETGLGDVKNGEGVYGLQRAFIVAGAQSVVMSLWKVSDQATQELMTDFYDIWLRTGNKAEAFKQAQLNLKRKHPEPYYWGAFVLVGV